MKVTAGVGLMQLILVAVAVSALVSFGSIQKGVSSVVDDYLPGLLVAGELQYRLERANSSLGFYLLSKEQVHKDSYVNSIRRVDEIIKKLQGNNTLVARNQSMQGLVAGLSQDISTFKSYQQTLLELATDRSRNVPAIQVAIDNVNPIGQILLQLASGMIASESEERPSAKRRSLLILLGDLRYAQANVMNAIRSYLANHRESNIDEINNRREAVQKVLQRLKEKVKLFNLDQEDSFNQFTGQFSVFKQGLDKVIVIHSSKRWRMDSYIIRTEVDPLLASIDKKVQALVAQLSQDSNNAAKGLSSETDSSTAVVLVLLVIIGVVVGFGVAWLITYVIVTPLNKAMNAMGDIAGGEGDLTQRLDDLGNDEISRLAHGFNSFAGIVQSMVKQVSGYTSHLAGEAERLAMVTTQTSSGAEHQLKETDQVVTAINEMATTGLGVAQSAALAAEAAQNADTAATKGRQIVGQTMESIDTLAGEVEKAGTVINQLEKDSEAIGGVLGVIKGIAEQTNLLALNAAIEAARAGEQGRGFAVVADEVRTLASRTQQSTAEIQTMIERLQSGAESAVQVMDESRQKAEAAVGQAAKAGTSLEDITLAVRTINEHNTEIASAAKEQNVVAENINEKVSRISEIIDQTAAGAQQTASSSNALSNLAEQLKTLMGQFKV